MALASFDLSQFENRPRLPRQSKGTMILSSPLLRIVTVRIPDHQITSLASVSAELDPEVQVGFHRHRTGARCRVVPKCSPGCSASSRTSGRRSCGGVTSIIDMGNGLHQNWQARFFFRLISVLEPDFPWFSIVVSCIYQAWKPKDLKATFLDGCAWQRIYTKRPQC